MHHGSGITATAFSKREKITQDTILLHLMLQHDSVFQVLNPTRCPASGYAAQWSDLFQDLKFTLRC
jgi:hypothetical protein